MLGGNKPRGGNAKERSVFVGNIPYDVTEDQLKEIFSEAGSVVNFRLVTDRETGKPKGYGFCEYADGATALSAMRNLNGYEVNGRNLRVDFADGGDKSSGGGGGGGHGGGGGDRGYHHHRDQFSHHQYHQQQPGVSGEMAINAIESAIAKFGPLKLYDMLVALKEHARQKPEHTKGMLGANPALTHAIVQAYKSLQIPIPSPAETQAALMHASMPMGMMQPQMAGRPMMPPQMQRGPPMGPPMPSVMGMAPPPHSGGMMPTPPNLAAPAPAPAKAGGTRWSARPGPLSMQMSAAVASSPGHLMTAASAPTTVGLMPAPTSSGQIPAPTNAGRMSAPPVSHAGGLLPPPTRTQPPPQSSASILGAPPQSSASILGAPPQSSASILGAPPQSSASILGAPPQSSASILGAPPQSSTSALGAPPQASSSILGAPPPQASSSILGLPPQSSSSILGAPPPQSSASILGALPPQSSASILGAPPPQSSASILGAPPGQAPAAARNRDPRRAARDPRLAKRGFEPAAPSLLPEPAKRHKPMDSGPPASSHSAEFDAIAELARDMTPEKLDMLPPEERQMLLSFMQQNNIPFHGR